MWQRKQTLFLLASVVAIIICLLSPIGAADNGATGIDGMQLLTNIGWTSQPVEGLPAWPLFVLATVAGILSIVGIFLYTNRRRQMRLCSWAMLADMLWYVYYFVFYATIAAQLHIRFAACLPLVSCILLWLAKKGIKADDDLVKSMDRIR